MRVASPNDGRGEKMGKKISGSAVSLYLRADVKHLHDLACQDPNIKPSEIYANALKAALGDVAAKHPIQMMRDAQAEEVRQIEEQLLAARSRLHLTETRLPLEVAKAEWLARVLGVDQVREMRALWSILFFDATGSGKYRPRSAKEGIARYRELVSRYEATKNGPEGMIDSDFTIIDDRHPVHLIEGPNKLCVNANDLTIECGEPKLGRRDGKWEVWIEPNPIGFHLGDDLQYYCSCCWNERKSKHTQGQLKPFWELEEMTVEMHAMDGKTSNDMKGRGLIEIETVAISQHREKMMIARFIENWERENHAEAEELEVLTEQRNSKIQDKNGIYEPTWEGLPWGNGSKRIREQRIRTMTNDEKTAYRECLDRYGKLLKQRSLYIKTNLQEWRQEGMPWTEFELKPGLFEQIHFRETTGTYTDIENEITNAIKADRRVLEMDHR